MCDADVTVNKPEVCAYIDDILEDQPVMGCLEDAEFVVYSAAPYNESYACADHLGMMVSDEEVSVIWPVDLPAKVEPYVQAGRFRDCH